MKNYYYSAGSGQPGCYGMASPITRERAKRLLRYAAGMEKSIFRQGMRWIHLSIVPKEAKYATEHGARGGYLLIGII
jgi:hypothetical protein